MAQSSGALGTDDIKQLLIKQAVPASIGILFMSVNILVDTIFVGQWIGSLAIAAVTVVLPITFLISSLGMAIGIGGSSMGGLVSLFSGLIYPEVYGKLMIFSPSLWVIPKIKFSFLDFFEPMETKIYLYAGGEESATMVTHIKKFKKR